MKIYFDRSQPMYLLNRPTFDGIVVDVDESIFAVVRELQTLIIRTDKAIQESSAPERSNQVLAEDFVTGLKEILNGYQ